MQNLIKNGFALSKRKAERSTRRVRAGEWTFEYNELVGHSCWARRNGRKMWVGNGGFFLDINGMDAFGLILRHYVWLAAVGKAREESDMKKRPKTPDYTA